MSAEAQQVVRDNVVRVRERMTVAALRAGRSPEEIRLVAVTKYVDAATVRLLINAGVTDIGESRPQELWAKAAALEESGSSLHWHLVGSLQRNKASRTIAVAHLIHSIDSLRLAETVGRLATEAGKVQDILLEVNLSGELAKHGLPAAEDQLRPLVTGISAIAGLQLCGLMGMAGLDSSPEQCRRQFGQLRELRESLAQEVAEPARFTHLSMGMSDDFEIAVECGATIVRIGSVLFEGLL